MSLKTRVGTNIIIVIVLLLCVCWIYRDFMFLSINRVEPDISTEKLAEKKLNELSGMMGIRFPKDTILLNIAEDRCKDIIISFKVQISSDQLEELLKSHPFNKVNWKGSEDNSENYFQTQSDLDWWRISRVQNWKSGHFRLLQDYQGCNMLIDNDRQDA